MTLLTSRVGFPLSLSSPRQSPHRETLSVVCFLGDPKPCSADSHSQPSHLPTFSNAETRDLAKQVSQFAFLLL